MSRRIYNALTTVSLIVVAASAVLYDRVPGHPWAFGIVAGACAVLSAWVYLAYGMNKDRENSDGAVAEAVRSETAEEFVPAEAETPSNR